MSGVRHVTVGADEADQRLDRWFKRHFPTTSHIRLEKLLRTGQVRIDGRRAKSGDRLAAGQAVRVPPLDDTPVPAPRVREISEADRAALEAAVLYRDRDFIALDKPPGLAVQGGTGITRHLDAMLDALAEGGERPKLVHRLDRDTSGVLLLARSAKAAARLGAAFRGRDMGKTYWALVVGTPKPQRGRIDLALGKAGGAGAERMVADAENAKPAASLYAVMEAAGKKLAWVALRPLTGRTHQLRAHMAAIGTPILGDGKYGGADAFISGLDLAPTLHLHARALVVPTGRARVRIEAPLPPHMAAAFAAFGFDASRRDDPFEEVE